MQYHLIRYHSFLPCMTHSHQIPPFLALNNQRNKLTSPVRLATLWGTSKTPSDRAVVVLTAEIRKITSNSPFSVNLLNFHVFQAFYLHGGRADVITQRIITNNTGRHLEVVVGAVVAEEHETIHWRVRRAARPPALICALAACVLPRRTLSRRYRSPRSAEPRDRTGNGSTVRGRWPFASDYSSRGPAAESGRKNFPPGRRGWALMAVGALGISSLLLFVSWRE